MNLQRPSTTFAPLGAVFIALGLSACGGGGQPASPAQATESGTALASVRGTATAPTAQPTNTEGRLLASNCFQCHGTLGTGGFEEIRGESANELLEYQRKPADRNIMAAHAQGFTPEQLRKIAAYLNQ